MKKPVAIRSLTARINRKLAKDGQKLMKNSPKWVSGYGEYSIVNTDTNVIDAYHVDIEKLAKEIKCLAEYEELAE